MSFHLLEHKGPMHLLHRDTKNQCILQPPLKWAGGKRAHVRFVKPCYDQFSGYRLVEPFAGGLGISFGLAPERVLANDCIQPLINFYRHLQRGYVVDYPLINTESFYYSSRSKFNDKTAVGEIDDKEYADLFFYLNRVGYNGLCRFNKNKEFNVPYSRYTQKLKLVPDYHSYKSYMSKWEFTLGDFSKLQIQDDDFLYVDPPYYRTFTNYSSESFSWDEQVRLVQWLDGMKNPVILNNAAEQPILDLYAKYGYTIRFANTLRSIGQNKESRKRVDDVIAFRGIDLSCMEVPCPTTNLT